MPSSKPDLSKDFTPGGMKLEAAYENDRNVASAKLFEDIICEAFRVLDNKVIVAHHLTFVRSERRSDGFDYQVVQEIPSADALIFDHDIAERLWGPEFQHILTLLALRPIATRDQLLAELYYGRKGANAPHLSGSHLSGSQEPNDQAMRTK